MPAKKRGKIFNKNQIAMKVEGTCDIKLCDRNLYAKERKGVGKKWPRTMVRQNLYAKG
jgi:hypothetical protein